MGKKRISHKRSQIIEALVLAVLAAIMVEFVWPILPLRRFELQLTLRGGEGGSAATPEQQPQSTHR